VAFLGCAGDTAAAAALTLLGLQLRSRDRITDFLSEFEKDLDSALAKRLLSHIEDGDARAYDASLTRARALATLERDIAARFANSNSDLARRALPFVRGKYTPWRVPIRSAILLIIPNLSSLRPVLDQTLPGFWPTTLRDPQVRFQDLVDDAIEAAEYGDRSLELLHNCSRFAKEGSKEAAQLQMLSTALERYAGVIDSFPT
jgi:hypothetical protein